MWERAICESNMKLILCVMIFSFGGRLYVESKTPVQSNKRSVSLDNIVDAILKHPDLLSVKAKSLNTFLRKLDDYEVNKFAKKRATLVKKRCGIDEWWCIQDRASEVSSTTTTTPSPPPYAGDIDTTPPAETTTKKSNSNSGGWSWSPPSWGKNPWWKSGGWSGKRKRRWIE